MSVLYRVKAEKLMIANLERAGYRVVSRVHDEIVWDAPEGRGSIEEFKQAINLPQFIEEGQKC